MKTSVGKIALAAIASTLTVVAHADDEAFAEQWECKLSGVEDWDEIVIRTDVEVGHQSGTLTAAGVRNETLFQVKGLERLWSFTKNSDGGYDYTFIITANHKGKFYDFTKSDAKAVVSPSKVLECRREDD